jgi:hypothetical protein
VDRRLCVILTNAKSDKPLSTDPAAPTNTPTLKIHLMPFIARRKSLSLPRNTCAFLRRKNFMRLEPTRHQAESIAKIYIAGQVAHLSGAPREERSSTFRGSPRKSKYLSWLADAIVSNCPANAERPLPHKPDGRQRTDKCPAGQLVSAVPASRSWTLCL